MALFLLGLVRTGSKCDVMMPGNLRGLLFAFSVSAFEDEDVDDLEEAVLRVVEIMIKDPSMVFLNRFFCLLAE